MSSGHHCLNCGEYIENNYCGHCGQKAATHRYSVRHFIEHDFVHGVFHWDKGFLYTAKHLLTQPGHAIRAYIEGKRVKHFNSITLLLMLVAINVIITSLLPTTLPEDLLGKEGVVLFNAYVPLFLNNMKFLYLVTIPLYAFFSYILFFGSKFNYAEHIVLQTYRTCGVLILQILLRVITSPFDPSSKVGIIAASIVLPVIFLYEIWYYKQFFSPYYKNKFSIIFRANAVTVMPVLLFILLSALTLSLFGSEELLNELMKHIPQTTNH